MKNFDKCIRLLFSAGWLLTCLLASGVQAGVGPALTGITARADDASTVFWSPAGITRLERPELMTQATVVAMESKFNVKESNRDGGNADYDSSLLLVPGIYYAHPARAAATGGRGRGRQALAGAGHGWLVGTARSERSRGQVLNLEITLS